MLASVIRTVVPLLVGVVLTYAAKIGLQLDEAAVLPFVTAVVTAAYYAVARIVEHFTRYGRLLLTFGLTARQPVYVQPDTNRRAARAR
jgi:hypothetical protein